MSAAFMEQLIPLLLTITPLMLSRTQKHWKEEVKSFYAELDRTCSFFTTNKQKGKKKEIISCISSHEHTHNKLQHRDDARLLVSLEHIQYNQFGILEKKKSSPNWIHVLCVTSFFKNEHPYITVSQNAYGNRHSGCLERTPVSLSLRG